MTLLLRHSNWSDFVRVQKFRITLNHRPLNQFLSTDDDLNDLVIRALYSVNVIDAITYTSSIIPPLSTDKDSLKSSNVNTYELSEDTEDKKKNLNSESLSRCEAAAVADRHLTVTEQRECYRLACNDDD